jgi:hypothetical protein
VPASRAATIFAVTSAYRSRIANPEKKSPGHAGAWKTRKTAQSADQQAKPAADDLPGELSRCRPEGDVEKWSARGQSLPSRQSVLIDRPLHAGVASALPGSARLIRVSCHKNRGNMKRILVGLLLALVYQAAWADRVVPNNRVENHLVVRA